MAVKKRTTLRSKSLKRTVPGAGGVASVVNAEQQKDKLINKIAEKQAQKDADKMTSTTIKSNTLANQRPVGVSKSAIRRRKRKLRDELRPKLTEDLLDALTESTNTTISKGADGTEEITIREKVRLNHAPNPHNKRGEMALFKIESEQFKQVLKDDRLRKGGLSALRDSILTNMANQHT